MNAQTAVRSVADFLRRAPFNLRLMSARVSMKKIKDGMEVKIFSVGNHRDPAREELFHKIMLGLGFTAEPLDNSPRPHALNPGAQVVPAPLRFTGTAEFTRGDIARCLLLSGVTFILKNDPVAKLFRGLNLKNAALDRIKIFLENGPLSYTNKIQGDFTGARPLEKLVEHADKIDLTTSTFDGEQIAAFVQSLDGRYGNAARDIFCNALVTWEQVERLEAKTLAAVGQSSHVGTRQHSFIWLCRARAIPEAAVERFAGRIDDKHLDDAIEDSLTNALVRKNLRMRRHALAPERFRSLPVDSVVVRRHIGADYNLMAKSGECIATFVFHGFGNDEFPRDALRHAERWWNYDLNNARLELYWWTKPGSTGRRFEAWIVGMKHADHRDQTIVMGSLERPERVFSRFLPEIFGAVAARLRSERNQLEMEIRTVESRLKAVELEIANRMNVC